MKSKEKFENIDNNHIIHCDICGNDYTKAKFIYRNVKENCNNGMCIYCDWMKRHDNIIPKVDGWTDEEVKIALKFILVGDSIYLNDLINVYEYRTLKDICMMISNLHIGNKHYLVKTKCEKCGKDVEIPPSVYLKNQNIYCSNECYWRDKPNKIPKGQNSPFYNRVDTYCSNCHKQISVIPSNYNTTNSYGDYFNFCSHECYWEFRSKYYTGDKSAAMHVVWTDEMREKQKLIMIQNGRKVSRLNSNIQLIINELLDKLNIDYKREYIIKYYAVDNYLIQKNLIIEVMGDYWHGNPNKYNKNHYFLNHIQTKTILKDKQKHTYIKDHSNIEILYLWESDILNNIALCEKLISEYIKKDGKLGNYHSFNYVLENATLKLKHDLVTPYQDVPSDKYKDIVKESA